jgi:hypothetical protein
VTIIPSLYKKLADTSSSIDEEILQELLQSNLKYEAKQEYSLRKELSNFLKFTSTMVWAFPVGLYKRWRIRQNKQLNYILQFKELLSVRNNIEKGSFAYDTLLFNQSPWQLFKNKSHLANLVCLAILFGDEFIDGIATEYGKQNIQAVLENASFNYYLQHRTIHNKVQLYYEFDICDVLPISVLESTNSKYEITYQAFYKHLQFLLSDMNTHLNKLDAEKAEAVATLICKACNKCFDTYKADINEFDENYTLLNLLDYQKTKDDDIIQVLLTLRAVLLDKKQLQYQKKFNSWSSMVRSMQLYDDMQDVATDCNFQMNTLCYFAKNYFITEWQWLQQHKTALMQLNGLALHSTVALYMPCSSMMLMQYARNIAHTKLSWVQCKIQNYLWRKNWLGFNNALLNSSGFCLSEVMHKNDTSVPLKLHFIKTQVMQKNDDFITEEMQWAHIIDIVLMDEELKAYLFAKITKKQKYFLTSCYIEYSIIEKATIAQHLFNH